MPPDGSICFFCRFELSTVGSKQVIHSLPPPFGSVYEMFMQDANVASTKIDRIRFYLDDNQIGAFPKYCPGLSMNWLNWLAGEYNTGCRHFLGALLKPLHIPLCTSRISCAPLNTKLRNQL